MLASLSCLSNEKFEKVNHEPHYQTQNVTQQCDQTNVKRVLEMTLNQILHQMPMQELEILLDFCFHQQGFNGILR
jgi:hypothetical protein